MEFVDKETKLVLPDRLRELNDKAERFKYNRQLADKFFEMLEDDSAVLLKPIMVHRHAAGREVEPHLRCWVWAWIEDRGNTESVRVMLDVTFEDFEELPDAEPILNTVEKGNTEEEGA